MLRSDGAIYDEGASDRIAFEFSGRPSRLLRLRTAVAVFKLLYFKVPHPLNVIQGPNLNRLIGAIQAIREGARRDDLRFESFRVSAAGSQSSAFREIKGVISNRTGLVNDEDTGEMSIRFRRSRLAGFGWDVLIRLTPRPLSARAWRVENMPGALNATIAAAMVLSTAPKPKDTFLNLMCGSGTILAERAAMCGAQRLIGVDNSSKAIEKARKNLEYLATPPKILHEGIDELSLPDQSVDVICADLPWGRLIGKRDELHEVYRAALQQASRVCVTGGRYAVLTQEIQLFEDLLKSFAKDWRIEASFRVKQSDYKPKLYLLKRERGS